MSGASAGGAMGSDGGASSGAGAPSAGGAPAVGAITAAQIAAKLGRPANFFIGMGNDLQPDHSKDLAYTLGPTLDLHYAYLVAYKNADGSWGSWKDWNPDGSFVNVLTDTAKAAGVTPMFTMYAMAAWGDGNLAGLSDDTFEKGYWNDIKLLYQRIALFGGPTVVHLEPDFWGYAQIQSKGDPKSMKVHVTANVPECADSSDDLVGMGQCLVKLARMYAPKAVIGFHASPWSGDPASTVAFMKAVGADKADVIFGDLLDRDAGCYEAGVDPNCKPRSNVYWDETNATSPNFHEYLAWSKSIVDGLGRPMIWWQIPFGVPSTTPGGSASHYRDNRVHYLFSHVQEFVDAGGLGATFGAGTGNQTGPDTDGGQFKAAVTGYFAHPLALR